MAKSGGGRRLRSWRWWWRGAHSAWVRVPGIRIGNGGRGNACDGASGCDGDPDRSRYAGDVMTSNVGGWGGVAVTTYNGYGATAAAADRYVVLPNAV